MFRSKDAVLDRWSDGGSIRRINICAMPRKKKQPRVPGFWGDRTHWPHGPDRRDRRLCVIQA